MIILFLLFIVPIIAVFLLALCGIDELIFGRWLGKKNEKFRIFADCSKTWLSLSYRLPRKMKKYSLKYWWVGILLMLVSPAALVTYTSIYIAKQEFSPSSLEYDEVPYKEYKDIVAITGLEDFPTFHYLKNEVSQGNHIHFTFEKELSSDYIQKLTNLCASDDNVYWSNEGDTCFVLHRAWDEKYIKSPVKSIPFEPYFTMSISRKGFTIHTNNGYCSFDLEYLADSKNLSERTGISFPPYKLVNFCCVPARDPYGEYKLLLDKKPTKEFIQQIEESSKWEKKDDSLYVFYSEYHEGLDDLITDIMTITVNSSSRVIHVKIITF